MKDAADGVITLVFTLQSGQAYSPAQVSGRDEYKPVTGLFHPAVKQVEADDATGQILSGEDEM